MHQKVEGKVRIPFPVKVAPEFESGDVDSMLMSLNSCLAATLSFHILFILLHSHCFLFLQHHHLSPVTLVYIPPQHPRPSPNKDPTHSTPTIFTHDAGKEVVETKCESDSTKGREGSQEEGQSCINLFCVN
jgi:hypothetical protein